MKGYQKLKLKVRVKGGTGRVKKKKEASGLLVTIAFKIENMGHPSDFRGMTPVEVADWIINSEGICSLIDADLVEIKDAEWIPKRKK